MQNVFKEKIELRKKMLSQLKIQKEETRLKKSSLIAKKFFALPEVKRARHIMFYLSLADEVKTYAMIEKFLEKGKKVSVPVITNNKKAQMRPFQVSKIKGNLKVGPLGIMHPKKKKKTTLDKIDLVVVPALAFDKNGARLGRGRGYYDKFLSKLPGKISKIGLAFKFQVLNKIPHLPHDIYVDKVVAA